MRLPPEVIAHLQRLVAATQKPVFGWLPRSVLKNILVNAQKFQNDRPDAEKENAKNFAVLQGVLPKLTAYQFLFLPC